jgi:purine-binding chemotaxis protein CheW
MGEMSAPRAPAQVREWIVLEAGNIQCGIAITQIQEINKHIDMTPVHHAPAYVRGVVNLRGQIVTVVDLRSNDLPPLELDEDALSWSGGGGWSAADRIQDIVVADAADILDPPANIRGVTGAFFGIPDGTGPVASCTCLSCSNTMRTPGCRKTTVGRAFLSQAGLRCADKIPNCACLVWRIEGERSWAFWRI